MNQRIRINEQGQLTETRPVNQIKINGQNRPTADYPDETIRDADGGGWLIPVYAVLPEGAVAHVVEWERDGLNANQIVHEYWTREEIDAQNAQAELDAQAAAEAQRIADYAQRMAAIAPVLAEHPDPLNVVAGGMFYRLPDPVDPDILTLWYVRDSDLIAQQLSSHDAAGMPINRSVNLRTRESVAYSMEEIIKGLKGNQANAKKTGNVGAARRRAHK